MRFFPRAEFMAVFPPMDASTCANKVVGILTNLIPLLVMLETKADKSPWSKLWAMSLCPLEGKRKMIRCVYQVVLRSFKGPSI